MNFVLHYRGTLKANGGVDHIHTLRQCFHLQLRTLWSQPPLSDEIPLLQPRVGGSHSLLRPMLPFTFAPLVTAEMNAVAELTLTMLRPEPPGKLITKGGDIDNRVKTLFDALTMPRHLSQLPTAAAPMPDQTPFFCLLEDDNLVTAVAVRTEQLLEPLAHPSQVELLISVRTRVTRQTMDNFSLA